jgi:hypothetical protein
VKAGAVYAHRFGWRVVPLHDVTSGRCSCGNAECRSAGKHPRLREWQREASSDPDVIAEWIEAYPTANVGIATGGGLMVLDVDPGGGGFDTLEALTGEYGDLPDTPTAETGSGGMHYFFTVDGPIPNSASKLGAGLDVRGDGGQVVAAPSRSLKGAYRWLRPPWKQPLAPAPLWLVNLIRARSRPVIDGPPPERGYFPAAAPEVLAAARAALERHGPAVQGHGGDDHTFRAAALLVHDYALTDDEAWPLLSEWNEACSPPWADEDLRAKLAGGAKYGTAEFGCKRTLDVYARATKLIEDWRTEGLGDATSMRLAASLRELIVPGVDPTAIALIERDWHGATGLGSKSLALPKASAAAERQPLEPGEVEVSPRLHEMADAAIKGIAPAVYQRSGVLCEVVTTKPGPTFISDLENARIQDLMSRARRWIRFDEQGKVEQAAPEAVAKILGARRNHPRGIRMLEAVTTAPIFLPDGEILQTRGYNAAARVYLEPSVSVQVADHPDHGDAVAAVAVFRDLLGDFRFATPADFSSWLAGLLSPLVKTATGYAPTPLICVSASTPGAGKSLLTNLIAQIITGEMAELSPYNPKDPAEWGKRLTAFVKAASPVRVLDNCNGPIGDEALDRLITSSRWSDRILGASEAPPLVNATTWFATGNNIEPVGDTVRRVLMVRVEVDTERPQERKGFRYDLEGGHVIDRRSELLSAALTILRAYHCAGRPALELPSWGSFTAWSALVRRAIVWAGAADPFLTQQRAMSNANEFDHEAHDFWLAVIEESDGQLHSIVEGANRREAATVLNLRESVTAYSLRKLVHRFVDKPRQGKRIRRETDRGVPRFYVERIS